MSLEVRIPVSSFVREKILRAEWEKHVREYKPPAVNNPLERYKQMGHIGKIFHEIFMRENRARVKACENPDIMKFLKKFIEIGKKRALEMDYRYEDIELSNDSGITENGILELKFVPRLGAEKVNNGR